MSFFGVLRTAGSARKAESLAVPAVLLTLLLSLGLVLSGCSGLDPDGSGAVIVDQQDGPRGRLTGPETFKEPGIVRTGSRAR
jgi:hypothetical protein